MRIAIVHYHLHTGGVTRIIEHSVSALQAKGIRVVVLSGEAPAGQDWKSPTSVVSSLAYDTLDHSGVTPRQLAGELDAAAREALGGPPDLWHVHNHSLGKNLSLPGALHQLAESGQRLLLQIHDFPEDGRPANYRRMLDTIGRGDPEHLSTLLYPQAGQIHYAVLNSRDLDALREGGCPAACLHVLPNPIWLGEPGEENHPRKRTSGPFYLYPTRAIRRKNIGEFLLWSAVADTGTRFATTRGPLNPAERPAYERWRSFSAELGLPVQFGIGEEYAGSFESLLRSADSLVTTSVAEGFGLAFLEPWLIDRPVTGRNLPEITHEFEQAGVELNGLYDRVEIPVDWIGLPVLEKKVQAGLDRVLGAYGRKPVPEDAARTLGAWIRNARVDFGRLDEPLQEQLIRMARDSVGARTEIEPARLVIPDAGIRQIHRNRKAILDAYSLGGYGEKLTGIYHSMQNSPVEPPGALSGTAILDCFIAPERLHLLRS